MDAEKESQAPEDEHAKSVFSQLSGRLDTQSISSRVLLGDLRLADEASRLTGQYQDPRYFPFYYHVARVMNPRRILCVGLELGLQLSCLLKGCQEAKEACCLQPATDDFYSPRLALSNIKSVAGSRFPVQFAFAGVGHISDMASGAPPFDIALIVHELHGDALAECMDLCWGLVREGGCMVVDHLFRKKSESLFVDFSKFRGSGRFVFDTRYRTGIVLK